MKTPPGNISSEFWTQCGLSEWVAIDLETTGLDPKTDAIIELGAVRFRNGEAVETFSRLVNPLRKLPQFIIELTGIANDDLTDQPPLDVLADDFIDFAGESPLLGQNVGFDLGFLDAAPSMSGHFSRARTVPLTHDTSVAARFVSPCLDYYGLATLARRYNVSASPRHRAADDAAATGEVFASLLPLIAAVPMPEIAQALRFVEGTASPLANSLRAIQHALKSGYTPEITAPDPLGSSSGRNNIFACTGDKRPTKSMESDKLRRLFGQVEKFDSVLPGYELRDEQVEMAVDVSRSFESGDILLVEAGTGVGKSLGYLIPALLSGKRVVISTHTKNLQDQLFFDEIPRLGELFRFGFKAALLKGRRNYLCRTRWMNWANNPDQITSPRLREQAATITRWANATVTGDISEVGAIRGDYRGGVFNLIVSQPGFCRGRVCSGTQECHLPRIRRAAQVADLVIVNHSLVLADVASDTGLLGKIGHIILDEAHHLEAVATDQYSVDLSEPAVKEILGRVARLCRSNNELEVRLRSVGSLTEAGKLVKLITSDATELSQEAGSLFADAREMLQDSARHETNYPTPFTFQAGDKLQLVLNQAGQPLLSGLGGVSKRLGDLLGQLSELEEDDLPPAPVQELQSAADEILSLRDGLTLTLAADHPDGVFWVELPTDPKRAVRIKSAPLVVADTLHSQLWSKIESAVLCSATLSTGNQTNGFNHLKRRIGLDQQPEGRVRTAIYGSPFDYESNCLVGYAPFLPPPAQAEEHCQMVAEILADLSRKMKRNALILFTSYDAMRRVEKELNIALMGTDIELLVQGGAGRERMVRRLRKSRGTLLLGTDSLWEGIDVPGRALELVVIPRLPFDVPGDPVVAARIDRIKNSGGNPFGEYQIPSAVLKLRQGAGRLIRTATDRGVVLVLDCRAVTKGYGKHFRTALHGRTRVAKDKDELSRDVYDFFAGDAG